MSEQTSVKSIFVRVMTIAGGACVLLALAADLAYLHAETRRQAQVIGDQAQVISDQAEQIDALCEWVESACAQAEAEEAEKPTEGFGRRIVEKFRAVGRKTVDAFHNVDDKMNPQAGK